MLRSLVRPLSLGALLLALALVSIESAVADDAKLFDEINDARQRLDKAFQTQDKATIQSMMTDDHQSITSFYGKDMTVPEQMETLNSYVFNFVNPGSPTVKLLSDDVAITNFETLYDGTFEGRPLPDRVLVTEIWVKQDGVWLQRLYQETPVPLK